MEMSRSRSSTKEEAHDHPENSSAGMATPAGGSVTLEETSAHADDKDVEEEALIFSFNLHRQGEVAPTAVNAEKQVEVQGSQGDTPRVLRWQELPKDEHGNVVLPERMPKIESYAEATQREMEERIRIREGGDMGSFAQSARNPTGFGEIDWRPPNHFVESKSGSKFPFTEGRIVVVLVAHSTYAFDVHSVFLSLFATTTIAEDDRQLTNLMRTQEIESGKFTPHGAFRQSSYTTFIPLRRSY